MLSTGFRNYANVWGRKPQKWMRRSEAKAHTVAKLTTPSAPLKEASRYFIEVASTPPLRGGEYISP